MGRDGRISSAGIIGPHGKTLTLGDLPPVDNARWGCRQKAVVVLAVLGGLISMDEACRRYRMSVEEFLGWERALSSRGVDGLKVGAAQQARRPGGAKLRQPHGQRPDRAAAARAPVH